MVRKIGLKYLFKWDFLSLFSRYDYVEIIRIFMMKYSSFMQVIHWCTTALRSWLSLQRVKNRNLFIEVSTRLKDTTIDSFIQNGYHQIIHSHM
jgi:hypothetical protein